MTSRITHERKRLLLGVVLVLASPIFATMLLWIAPVLRVEIGPGDADYVQGFSSDWHWTDDGAWRRAERRSRIRFPATVSAGGSFSFLARYRGTRPASLRVHFDDDTTFEMTVAPTNEYQRFSFELPARRIRAHARLRFEGFAPGNELRVTAAEWNVRRPLPQSRLVRASAVLLLGTFTAMLVAGTSTRAAFSTSAITAAILLAFSAADPFGAVHLVLASVPVALVGLGIVAAVRVLGLRLGTSLSVLFFFTLVFRAGLLFHPSYHFYDLPIHENLVELIYHRGVADFWIRWPEYHRESGLGHSIVDGERRALLYPILFHCVVHLGNKMAHAPVLWLKLFHAVFAALAVFPVGYLAKRWSSLPRVDLMAGLLYVLIPTLTRSVFLLKFAGTLGHLLDLCIVAYLAHVSLRVDRRARWLVATLLVTASLLAYNSGFVHIGLLIGACLALAPVVGGLPLRPALGLASAGLAGLALAIVGYHPEAVVNLLSSLGKSGPLPADVTPPAVEYSAAAMTIESLGIPLIVIGIGGLIGVVGVWTARESPAALRLLLYAWLASGAIAHGLRYVFPELLVYQKEHYWIGAMFAVTGSIGIVHLWRRRRAGSLLAGAALLAALGAWIWELYQMRSLFYGPYLF